MKIGTRRKMEDGIMKKIFYIAASLLVLAACTRETDIEAPAGVFSIFARTETSTETKTIVEGDIHVYWEPGDEILRRKVRKVYDRHHGIFSISFLHRNAG